jgi:purine-nucleoside phosphorylase
VPNVHINAEPGAFADTVLMPGDPLRAKYIAETFFEGPRQVTNVRNMLGFTGSYRGQRVSAMGHGMGIPSALIYFTELVNDFAVRRIIRVGSCGAIHPRVSVRDLVIAMGASTDSGVNRSRFGGRDLAALASFPLLFRAEQLARDKGLPFHVGNVFTSDLFYGAPIDLAETLARFEILAIEMETAGLYGLGAELGVERLAILTVSDDERLGEVLSGAERQESFDTMIELALETAVASG